MEYPETDLPPVEENGRKSRFVGRFMYLVLLLGAAAVGGFSGLLLVYSTDLPEVGELERFRPSAITELYDDQGRVIATFAIQRRIIAQYEDFSPTLRNAVLSIEDKDFFDHWGISIKRGFGAAYRDLASGSRAQGASTITMQLARNLFLSHERTFSRKFQEALLSIQIERRFTKPQIFTMYSNQIYLGHGVYGFEAGAQYYFGKRAKDVTLAEAALLASLPKAPNGYSPVTNPDRALKRRNLVLNSMLEDGLITKEQADRAKATPILVNPQPLGGTIAPWFAEEVRQYLEKKYGSEQVHQGGLRVYTTLNMEMQLAANKAVLDGLAAYERRQGWRGGLRNVIREGGTIEEYRHPDWAYPLQPGAYVHAVVTSVTPNAAIVRIGRRPAQLALADMAWTRRKTATEILKPGDIAYVRVLTATPEGTTVALEQDTGVQGALLAIDNATGDVKAMVGGRSFAESKFNRTIQAQRQVGSAFKPFVYTAAMDTGSNPDELIVDTPTTFMSAGVPYTPRNYDGKFEGAIPLRRALAQSRNVPAVKLAERVGMGTVVEYARKFGITSKIPAYLPVALGAAEVTLIEETSAFSAFPNDGVRVEPHFIRKVTDYDGLVLEENYPEVHDVIPPATARTMVELLQGVVRSGTATAALKLNHPLAGKTGTTNDFTDAWFIGFSPSLTAGVWIGYDEKKVLGNKETGGVAALPIWIDFMKVALRSREGEAFPAINPAPPPAAAAKQIAAAQAANPTRKN